MIDGQRHLIECRCALPQYQNHTPVIFHKFTVFSTFEFDESHYGDLENEPAYTFNESYARCNNCGILHRIIDFCRSEFVNDEETTAAFLSTSDMEFMIPEAICNLLKTYDSPQYVWEEVLFTVTQRKFDRRIILDSKRDGDNIVGKFLVFSDTGVPRIEMFSEKTTF